MEIFLFKVLFMGPQFIDSHLKMKIKLKICFGLKFQMVEIYNLAFKLDAMQHSQVRLLAQSETEKTAEDSYRTAI